MRWKFRIGLEAVTFTAGVGAGILVTQQIGAETDDWLSFAGALLGAALAVLGALMVVEFQTSVTERARHRLYTDQFADILRLIDNVRNPAAPGNADIDALRSSNAELLTSAIERLKQTRQWVTPDTAAMVEVMEIVERLPGGIQVLYGPRNHPNFLSEEQVDNELRPIEAAIRFADRLLNHS
jgi:hypothetical protein